MFIKEVKKDLNWKLEDYERNNNKDTRNIR